MAIPTRKLAAIMFTDIVGYTALMGKNEADTLRLLQENHNIQKSLIESYGGHFIKEIGDGLLAYFENVVDAVHCSVEIQSKWVEISDAKIRIGIHYAEIILENNDIYGDGVNIASRIEALADPGGIYISDAVKNALIKEQSFGDKYLGRAKLKNVKRPVNIYAIQAQGLPEPSMKRFHKLANPKKKFAIIPTLITFSVIVAIALLIVKYLDKRAKIIQAEASLDKIENLVNLNWRDFSEAYYLAKEVELVIPKNLQLREYIENTSVKINISTDPPGAFVYYKLYDKPEGKWMSLGITPLDSVQLPISALRFRIEKSGYETVLAAAFSFKFNNLTRLGKFEMYTGQDFHRTLDRKGSIPKDMTRVPGRTTQNGKFNDFFIDKLEVSNQQYKYFIDHDGYLNKSYWKELESSLLDTIEWEEAINFFVDKTGKPGPSTWANQKYPDEEEEFPVNGISWFEANAYANFIGKEIPTADHWGMARGDGTMLLIPQVGGNEIFAPFSNFNVEGPVEIGVYDGITSYGAFDMAGNVREWCWNESSLGRCIRGGAWNNNPYMFYPVSQISPFDRSAENGFRCVIYLNRDSIPDSAFGKVEVNSGTDFNIEVVNEITEDQFEWFKTSYYEYDRVDLQSRVISSTENDRGWVLEKIEFNTAYDNERMVCYIFVPTNTNPPYQSVVYGHSSNALYQENSDNIEQYFEFKAFLEFLVQNGRAVVFPIIKGTFGQRPDSPADPLPGSYQKTTHLTRKIKDYRRCLDYLQTRNDFNMGKIAFFGMSWGPRLGTFLTAVDSRIKTNIFYAGGIDVYPETKPEVNMVYFLTQVKIPTLMINGKFDIIFPLDNITTMFNLLGTSEKNKKLVLCNSDHLAPVEVVMNETLTWLDLQFGKVDYSVEIKRL